MLRRLSNFASFEVSFFVLIALHSIFSGNLRGEEKVFIEIDSEAPRVQVSPDLYGIFFEEINHAGEGGLYAEMVENRDSEIAIRMPHGEDNLLIIENVSFVTQCPRPPLEAAGDIEAYTLLLAYAAWLHGEAKHDSIVETRICGRK